MTTQEFRMLPDGIYTFELTSNQVVVGVPISALMHSGKVYFVPMNKLEEYRLNQLKNENYIERGIYLEIDPTQIKTCTIHK